MFGEVTFGFVASEPIYIDIYYIFLGKNSPGYTNLVQHEKIIIREKNKPDFPLTRSQLSTHKLAAGPIGKIFSKGVKKGNFEKRIFCLESSAFVKDIM